MATSLNDIGDEPAHYADCCVAVSRPLIQAIVDQLPLQPALILSVGSGTGFLESLLLQHAKRPDGTPSLNMYGIEVPTCLNKYLPEDCLLRVASTSALYSDVIFASVLIFVYPRQVSLIYQYLEASLNGALEKVLWLGHRSDWPDTKPTISAAFANVAYFNGPGIAEYELLVIATEPIAPHKTFAQSRQH